MYLVEVLIMFRHSVIKMYYYLFLLFCIIVAIHQHNCHYFFNHPYYRGGASEGIRRRLPHMRRAARRRLVFRQILRGVRVHECQVLRERLRKTSEYDVLF